jgi:hypothetical protein
VRGAARPARGLAHPRGAGPGAGRHRRSLRGDARLGRRGRSSRRRLRLPHLHRGPLGSRPGRVAAPSQPGSLPPQDRGGRPHRLVPSLAARQDGAGGGRPWPRGPPAPPRPRPAGLSRHRRPDGYRLRGLPSACLRPAFPARHLRRGAQGRLGDSGGRLAGPLLRPTLRPPSLRARVPARARRPRGSRSKGSGEAVAARPGGGRRAASDPPVADVVGRTVPPRPLPGSARAFPGRGPGRARHGSPSRPRALAGGPACRGPRSAALRGRGSGRAAALEPGQPGAPTVARPLRRALAGGLPAFAHAPGGRGSASGGGVVCGSAAASGPRPAGPPPRARGPAVPWARPAGRAAPGHRPCRRSLGAGGGSRSTAIRSSRPRPG